MSRIFSAIIIFFSVNLHAQDFKVSVNKLTEETQQLSESPDNLKLVWWIPVEFWKAVFAEDESVPKEQADEIIEVFSQYTAMAILDGKIGPFGDVDYKSKDEIYNNLVLVDKKNVSYIPLVESEIDSRTQSILSFMKPVLGNMLGKLGDNMHFFLFQKKDNPLEPIIHPKLEETFSVKLSGEEFQWKLPLGSLLKPKICPVDGVKMNGSWRYCPYHGKELKS